MKLIEGRLKRLGESTTNLKTEVTKYSLIQIGDQTLTNVMVDRKLENFLQDGLQTEEPTKLWFLSGQKIIMGVQAGNDTRYYGTVNPFFYFALLFNIVMTCIGFSYHWGFGLLFGAMTYALFVRRLLDSRKVAAVGGTKV